MNDIFQKESLPDDFNRMPAAEKIIELLSAEMKISPLIIDGDWGAGKTVFCQKIIAIAKKRESSFTTVHIDAFKADHADQPLMTLLAAILNALPDAKQDSIMKKVLPVLKFGLKVAGKAGLSWLLRMNAEKLTEEIEKATKEIGEAVVDKAVEAMLVEHMEAEKSLSALRDALKEASDNMPLVVFIDELDRCRPDFAVRMLEVIKHVFDVDGVKFVLVTNTRQLVAAIRHCYGNEIEAQRYLDKFVGFCFKLPSLFANGDRANLLASQLHFKNMVKKSSVLAGDNALCSNGLAVRVIDILIEYKRPSLREIETFVRHFEVYHILSDKNGISSKEPLPKIILMVYAVYCHCFYPLLASDIESGVFDVARISESLGVTKILSPGSELVSIGAIAGLLLYDLPNAQAFFGPDYAMVLREYNGDILKRYNLAAHFSGRIIRVELVRDILRKFQLGCNG